jgi:putative radical SAM enzyme (TIGR03279 family)
MEGCNMELKKIYDDRNIIEKVHKGSIGDELDIEAGDILVSINNNKVKDIIDYKFLMSDEYIEVEIEKKNGEIWQLEIEKEFDEDLGIEFTNPLIDRARSCRNKCIFCFIDQLPPNMRETLYFKDDDSRLSFLQGNFITLTNMSDEEIDRIIAYRLSPINISVHTTNPNLRVKMLNNKNAGKIFSILKRFKEAELKVNCQIVLVSGVNDGIELERTLKDLSSLYPSVKSVAVVPVGITKYREGLPKLEPFNKETSEELLSLIEKAQNKFLNNMGTRFVFASDEFYAMTNRILPSYDEYEGFPQLENGVGLMKSFEYEVDKELENIKEKKILNKKYIIATGTLANRFMNKIKDKVKEKFKGLRLDVIPIDNNFFGKTITVSGLITGQDIIEQLRDFKDIDGIIIPKSMLRQDSDVFLDDLTVKDIENRLMVKIIPIEVSGKEFINFFRKA